MGAIEKLEFNSLVKIIAHHVRSDLNDQTTRIDQEMNLDRLVSL